MSSTEIKTFRETLGLSQQKLAEKLGVTQELVSQWEHDKRRPSRPVLMLFERLREEISDVAKNI